MKTMVVSVLSALMLAQAAHAEDNPRCAAKAASVERQIAIAQQEGQTHRVDGLERALGHLRADCTDAELIEELEAEVHEAQEEVREREADLAQARADGDDKAKIEAREAKLEEARAELKGARDALKP